MGYQRQHLLVIEKNLAQRKLISRALADQGFVIQFASSGTDGLAYLTQQQPDLVLLRWADGAGDFRRLREYSTAPIFVLLGVDSPTNKVTPLDMGADDCLIAPFREDELRARIQALLRRVTPTRQINLPGAIRVGDLQINFDTRQLLRDGQLVSLSQTEWRLLELLVQQAGQVISHEMLCRLAWGDAITKESSNLRGYIHRLRSKLEADPENPRYLVSQPRVGYCFLAPRESVNVPVQKEKENKSLRRPAQLPVLQTSFVGWAGELERLKNLLQTPGVHLVSLIGPGGAGKTRLGVQVAHQLSENFEHGVCFVALSAIQNASLVGAAIAQALGIQEEKGLSIEESLKAHLAGKKMLLLLDNFEQVTAAAPLVSTLLETNRDLKILITSRSVLRLYGEHEFEVPPLALPDLRQTSIDDVFKSQAVALFIERARAIQPNFKLTPQNVAAVAALCVQLDGLPLAIELAAARMKLLSPQAMVVRLSNRFALLADGAQNLPKRQQTMRNTLDWSYDLLTFEEKTLFARLGVFNGGFSMEAAEDIAGIPFEAAKNESLTIDPLAHLSSLLDKSMLVRAVVHDEIRFDMLETIREYARERLFVSGEADLLHQRHIHYYLRLVEAAHLNLQSDQAQQWIEHLEQEHDNLRTALQWALGRDNQQETVLRLVTMLGIFWGGRKHLAEGRRWLSAALSYGSENTLPDARAGALREAAWLALSQGDSHEAEKFLAMAQELSAALRDDPHVTCQMGLILDEQGKYEQASLLLQAALESFRQLDDKKNTDFALHILGQIAMKQANYDLAETYMKEAIAIQRKSLRSDVGRSLLTLAHINRLRGDDLKARDQYFEALSIFKKVELGWGVGHCLLNLGKVACKRGEFVEARQFYQDTLHIFDELGDYIGLAYCFEAQAALAGVQRQTKRAATLWGAAESLRKRWHSALPPADSSQLEADIENLRSFLAETGQPDEIFWAALKTGQTMPIENVVAFARDVSL